MDATQTQRAHFDTASPSHLPLGLENDAGPLRVDRLVNLPEGGFRLENLGRLHRVPLPNMQRLEFVLAGLRNQWDEESMRTLLAEIDVLEGEDQPEDVRSRVRRLRQELLAPLADAVISQRDIIVVQHRSSVERERRVCEAMLALQGERDAAIWRIQEQMQPEVAALVAEVESMAAQAQEMQDALHEGESHRLQQEALLAVLLEEKERLLERIAQEGPRAALHWARNEASARAARGDALPEYCERLLGDAAASSSEYDADERRSKKRRVASPARGEAKTLVMLEPMSCIVPLGFEDSKRKKNGLGQLLTELLGIRPDGILAYALETAVEEFWQCLERMYEKGLLAGFVCAPYILYQGSSSLLHRLLRRLCHSALVTAKKRGFAFQLL